MILQDLINQSLLKSGGKFLIEKKSSDIDNFDIEYFASRDIPFSQVIEVEDKDENQVIFLRGDSLGEIDNEESAFKRRASRVGNYFSKKNNIEELAPDLILTSSFFLDQHKRAFGVPDIKYHAPIVVGLGTSKFDGRTSSLKYAIHVTISNLNILRPKTKKIFSNPRPLTDHSDFLNRPLARGEDNLNLRILVQCVN